MFTHFVLKFPYTGLQLLNTLKQYFRQICLGNLNDGQCLHCTTLMKCKSDM